MLEDHVDVFACFTHSHCCQNIRTNRIGEGIAAGVKVVVMAAPPGFGKSTSSLKVAAAVRAGEDMWRVCVWSILRADEKKFEKSD